MARSISMSTHTRWTTAIAAAASLAIASSVSAQTPPPATPPAQTPPPATAAQDPAATPNPSQDAAKQHLTAARNALSELTQLPAASQLTGEARTQVQQLISNFNELITTNSNWRAAYARVEGTLGTLLVAEPPPAASGTAGAVGTSGTTPAIDPALRAKLVEFREHLSKFEAVAGATPAPAAAPAPAATEPPPTAAPPAAASTTSTSTTTTTTTSAPPEPRPDPEPEANQAVSPEDILLHIEAIEGILGAQATAQSAATAAAGGAVTTSPTASGSTKTTITNADVTLNPSQLDQIKAHLADIRRAVEKK